MPLFLLAAYTKGDKVNLTADEKKQLRKFTIELKKRYA